MKVKENYTNYLIAGLALSFFSILFLTIYAVRENTRLVQAAETYTSEQVGLGKEIYQAQCSACHGNNGQGGVGPALNDRKVLKTTLDNVYFSVIRSGVPNTRMPAWSVDYGGPLTDEDVRNLVAFIRAWEPTAPEIQPIVFQPDPRRGALLYASACAVCHGENGLGGAPGSSTTDGSIVAAPALNNLNRLDYLPDDWYRNVIRNGRPAKGMPTWGTVLSPNQIEDLVSLMAAWRKGENVTPNYSAADLLNQALYALDHRDPESALLQLQRLLGISQGEGRSRIEAIQTMLQNGQGAGALIALQQLSNDWPLGDPTLGAQEYTASCSACHGSQGEGGIGLPLRGSLFLKSQNNAELLAFIQDGRPGTAMAGFADKLSDTEIANIIAFLRLLQEEK